MDPHYLQKQAKTDSIGVPQIYKCLIFRIILAKDQRNPFYL